MIAFNSMTLLVNVGCSPSIKKKKIKFRNWKKYGDSARLTTSVCIKSLDAHCPLSFLKSISVACSSSTEPDT